MHSASTLRPLLGLVLLSACAREEGPKASPDASPQEEQDSGCAAEEIYNDGRDNDCDPSTSDVDADLDGYADDVDCDDSNPEVNPGAQELCDDEGVDENCDGLVNEGYKPEGTVLVYRDLDGDGFGDEHHLTAVCPDVIPDGWAREDGDCDDSDPETYPGAADDWVDGEDQDCDGMDGPDRDGDGYADQAAGGDDCDDDNRFINPSRDEVCDPLGNDDDCDGLVNDADPSMVTWNDWYVDADGDGYGAGASAAFCDPLPGYSRRGDDCDDRDPLVSPGALEICGDGQVVDCDLTRKTATQLCQLDSAVWSLEEVGVSVLSDHTSRGEGRAVALGGDNDGDGFADMAVSAPDSTSTAGQIWIFNGAPISDYLRLSEADAEILGYAVEDYAGSAMELGGDIDGDGLADLAISVPFIGLPSEPGAIWLLTGPITGHVWLGDVGVRVGGTVLQSVNAMDLGGDLDGDGLADTLAGASERGEAAVFTGDAVLAAAGSDIAWGDADAILVGVESGDRTGTAVDIGGDMDGDGRDDLAISAPYRDDPVTNAGAVYLIYGPLSSAGDLASAEASVGGKTPGGLMGQAVSMGGDSDGDGFADLAIGAPYANVPPDYGRAWVMLGPLTGNVTVALPDAEYVGGVLRDYCCDALALGGDPNGDGYADLLIGDSAYPAHGTLGPSAGLFFGPLSSSRQVDADVSMRGENGFAATGADLSMGGDFNGDGFGDILISSEVLHSNPPGFYAVATLMLGGGPEGADY